MTTHPAAPLLHIIWQDFPHAGATIPAAFLDEWEKIDTTYTVSGLAPSQAELTAAAIDALEHGRNLANDKPLLNLVSRQVLTGALGIERAVEHHAEQLRRNLIREHADKLLAALDPAFDAANATIEKAREQIPGLDLSHTQAVVGVPVEKMTLWGQANDAKRRIETIVSLWGMIGVFTGRLYIQKDMRPLILADITAEQLDELPEPHTADAPILHGLPLDLGTPEEFHARCDRVRAEWAHQVRTAREQWRPAAVRIR